MRMPVVPSQLRSLQFARKTLIISPKFVATRVFERCYASKDFAPLPPALRVLETQNDMNLARTWTESFRQVNIPREAVELTFSRSSGPGGQNVNKLNTKCSLRCPVSVEWIPAWARDFLRQSIKPAYVASSDSLLVVSMRHRSQAQNVKECLSKLQDLILSSSLSGVRNAPSVGQMRRVRDLMTAEKARRRKEKEHKSKIKQLRSQGD